MCEEQLLDLRGDVVEVVLKVVRRGSIAVAEAEVVRRDNVEVAGELRDQLPEHVRRRRKAMKQNDRRIRGRAGLAVEDLVALDGGMLVRSHVVLLIVNLIVCTRDHLLRASHWPLPTRTLRRSQATKSEEHDQHRTNGPVRPCGRLQNVVFSG